jgi:hypothetical protein
MTEKIEVTVKYVGHNDYTHEFPGEIVFHAIKVAAMRFFGLEESAASKYALQYNGTDLGEHTDLSILDKNPATLTLVLKEEVPKGEK